MKLLSTILLFSLPLIIFAQPGNPGGGVPIDGGASLLLAAGAAYGIKKAKDYRKKNH